MKRKVFLLMSLVTILIVGCATPYQTTGIRGGYSEFQLDDNEFRVQFAGNGFIGSGTVEIYLLFRCAELTKFNGYDYFIILASNLNVTKGSIELPGHYHSTTTIQAYNSGDYIHGTGTTSGTYSPGQSIPYSKYRKSAIIKMFQGDKPDDNPNAFDANSLLKYLTPNIRR
ncbi:MAG: hypothetical protein P9X24_15810 [Candidatus Hatepunaea meridiana]|nr:hypothetical protein [Candidatus Hatepunaea meridiana]